MSIGQDCRQIAIMYAYVGNTKGVKEMNKRIRAINKEIKQLL